VLLARIPTNPRYVDQVGVAVETHDDRIDQDAESMPLDIRIRFGRAIRRILEEQKLNQEEAAERCGLHRTYYGGIERAVTNVSLVNIEKVARGLRN
jgi:ActR/RegA family two-component response regulator